MASLTGTNADDTITATSSDDYLYGNDGNDLLIGGARSYGGDGNDTLETGDFAGDHQTMYGGHGNDLFVVNYDIAANDGTFSVELHGNSGSNVLDISAIADDISNITITGYSVSHHAVISIYDDEGTYLGKIDIRPLDSFGTPSISELIVGGQSYDFTVATTADEISSILIFGASDGDDTISSDVDDNGYGPIGVYGFAGNDTITAGADYQRLHGGSGADRLDTAGFRGVDLYGEDGNDTYVISWDGTPPAYAISTSLRDYADSVNDVLDLSDIADSFNQVDFSFYNNNMVVSLYDTDETYLGRVTIVGQPLATFGIEAIVIDGTTLALPNIAPQQTYLDLLNSITADRLSGGEGDDILRGFVGDDRLIGQAGDDSLYGGNGEDTLIGGAGRDLLEGGEGNDQLWAGGDDQGRDTMIGGIGDDTIGGGAGNDILIGDGTSETDVAEFGADVIFGGAGDDQIVTGGWLDDGDGRIENGERLNSSTDANEVYGGSGNDKIWGTVGSETLAGGADHDWISGHAGNDVLFGGKGAGNDTLQGNVGDDIIYGGAGDDRILGGLGNDLLFNGAGNDTVEGGSQNDTLYGGAGDDILTGDAGADLFSFAAGHGHDTVTDFDISEDLIRIAGLTKEDVIRDAERVTIDGQEGILITVDEATSVFLIGVTAHELSNAFIDS